MIERPYQTRANEAVIAAYDRGCHRQLVSMATGTGKTIVFSKLYEKIKFRLPGQMLILAHREELIEQNIDKMRLVNPSLKIDKEMAECHADPTTADAVVASIATLGRQGTHRLDNYNWDRVDKVIVDEAHHSVAPTYNNLLALSGVLQDDSKKLLLGVTATPQRGDGKALAKIYQEIVYVYSLRQAIEDGWLVDLKGYRINTQTDLSQIATVAGDFSQPELAQTVNTTDRNTLITEAWKNLAQGRQTVIFCAGVNHAVDLAVFFTQQGITAEAVWSDDPERSLKLKAHKDKAFPVVCNYGILTEGYDDPNISCIILARPTRSSVLFTQMIGRGTRIQIDKKDCVVIDIVDVSRKHSLMTLPTLMGLPGTLDTHGHSVIETLKTIEDLQKEYPTIDFTQLQSVDNVKDYIETFDLFELRLPDEIRQNSELIWNIAIDGGYKIIVPRYLSEIDYEPGYVTIKQNLFETWDIDGEIRGQMFHGVRDTVEEAFKIADEQIRKRAPAVLTLLGQKEGWHNKPATEKQMNFIRRLFPWKQFPKMTRFQAKTLIDNRLRKS